MKIRSILASCLAMLMLASCSKEGNEGPVDPADVAYVSINILKENATRAGSGEDPGNESALKSLYLVTFNNLGNIVGVPGTTSYFTNAPVPGSPNETKPEAVRIGGTATKLLIIANPGSNLLNALGNIDASSTYATVNSAIALATSADAISEITDNAGNTKGFAMISSGEEGSAPAVGDVISDPLVDISGKIKIMSSGTYATEADAKAAAEADRLSVKIERISSKLELKVGGSIAVTPSTGSFTFENWTLDALNKSFYPFAEKTLLAGTHTGTYYTKSFYTKDPNFVPSVTTDPVTVGEGLEFTTVNTSTFAPNLIMQWKSAGALAYCAENTMAATEQRFGNATRMVIKGKYYPDASWTGDWFNFAGVNYKDLDELKAAYTTAGSGSNLEAACDKMYVKIKAFADASGGSITLTGTDFSSLTTGDLNALSPYGGEIIKDGANDVIRWYQGGLNYYYYEIRHNDEITDEMAFGKYGVVRNNWYSMTLTSVGGPGTPWYPDINNPGPGDPDPTDPIDESAGYLGVTIDVAPWIIWNRDIGI